VIQVLDGDITSKQMAYLMQQLELVAPNHEVVLFVSQRSLSA
jgi:hypothetical protein